MPCIFTVDIAAFYEGYYKGKTVDIIKGTMATWFGTDEHGNVSGSCFFLNASDSSIAPVSIYYVCISYDIEVLMPLL